MSLVQTVQDGKIVQSASQTSVSSSQSSSTAKTSGSAYDKDTFLQLLVAEVKYQDPLEPSSNTEWISQYATFSELESMQNMSASYDLSRASALVGETVIMKVTGDDGNTKYIQGSVDYVTYENNKAFLSIEGSLYSMDDLYNVVDPTYLDAYDKAYNWSVALNKLTAIANISLDDKDDVEKLYEQYDKMSDYEKTFISSDNSKKITTYHEKIQELIKAQEAANNTADKDEDSTDDAGTSGDAGDGETS